MSLESRLAAVVAAIGADIKGLLSSLSSKNQKLTVKDEGTLVVSDPFAINFTGAGVSVSNAAGEATVTIAGGGGGSGPTYTTVKTANYTAAANEIVRIDSSAGSFTIALPATPTDAMSVGVFDVGQACNSFPVLISPGVGYTVEDDSTGLSVNVSGAFVPLVYSQSTGNWKIADMLGSGYIALTPAVTSDPSLSPFLTMGA